jgi:hypothetical protein
MPAEDEGEARRMVHPGSIPVADSSRVGRAFPRGAPRPCTKSRAAGWPGENLSTVPPTRDEDAAPLLNRRQPLVLCTNACAGARRPDARIHPMSSVRLPRSARALFSPARARGARALRRRGHHAPPGGAGRSLGHGRTRWRPQRWTRASAWKARAGDSRAEVENSVAHAAPALPESKRPDLSAPPSLLARAFAQKEAPQQAPPDDRYRRRAACDPAAAG